MAPEAFQISRRWPNIAPKWPQDGPRWPQEGPKLALDGPKAAPKWPKLVHINLYDGTAFAVKLARPQSGPKRLQ